ncbi:MAG: DUF6159 family protein [Rubripirellula sp.]|nr:DUF6159 family protein [Rubripirellula sp.]
MFKRFNTGFSLAKQSMGVLRTDKQLIMFPLLSGICCLMVMASFAVPLLMVGGGAELLAEAEQEGQAGENAAMQNPLYLVCLFLFYFVNYFVVVFFNSALIACAVKRFYGGTPTIGEGIKASMARLPQIAGWALVSASVGLLLRVIEGRSERLGAIISSLVGMAWSALTYFVVPVLVVEKAGPITAVKRSASILKESWGESMGASMGIGFVVFLAMIPCFGLIAGGAFLINVMAPLGIALIVLGVLAVLVVSLVSSALSAIAQAAVYIYGANGDTPDGFETESLGAAFTTR